MLHPEFAKGLYVKPTEDLMVDAHKQLIMLSVQPDGFSFCVLLIHFLLQTHHIMMMMIDQAWDSIAIAHLIKENEELKKESDELKNKEAERDHYYGKSTQL